MLRLVVSQHEKKRPRKIIFRRSKTDDSSEMILKAFVDPRNIWRANTELHNHVLITSLTRIFPLLIKQSAQCSTIEKSRSVSQYLLTSFSLTIFMVMRCVKHNNYSEKLSKRFRFYLTNFSCGFIFTIFYEFL